MSTAVVLANIGTPASPEPEDVGRYLRQFLMDPDVISIPFLLRWILVNILIVPRRKHKSSHAYKQVWTDRGSPLMFHTEDLVSQMNEKVNSETTVHLAMRYGQPSIEQVLSEVKERDQIIVLPMFPQFADATTTSVSAEFRRIANVLGVSEKLRFLPEFYEEASFIDSVVDLVQERRDQFDYLLFSYHGLPQSHILNRGGAHCLKVDNCCEQITSVNSKCYRAQCYTTTRAVIEKLGLKKDQYSVSFQSRLGRAEWIRPYTDEVVRDLAGRGVKRLGVVCPAFLIDCLETLEEIAIGVREDFISAGGEDLVLIPCLNADPRWSSRLVEWVEHSI